MTFVTLVLAAEAGGSAKEAKPKTAEELGECIAGTTWNIRDGSPTAAIQYTITFNDDGSFRHSDGRTGKVTFTGARTFNLWNYDPATLNEDLTAFRAKGTATVYFGSLKGEDSAPIGQPSPVVGSLVDPVALRGVEDVHLVGDHAFLPCREGNCLTICSIRNPAMPEVVSSFTHAELGQAAGLAIDGNIVYLTSQRNSKLLVIDASDKSALRLLGSVLVGPPGSGPLYKVAHRDGHCYVAHLREKKLFVVDVRDASQPVVVGSVAVTTENDGPFSVRLRGKYALVGTIYGHRDRLAVVDIDDPAEPRLVRQVSGPEIGHASGEFVGDLLFAVHWDKNALVVVDLADPGHPKPVAELVDRRLGKPNRCVVVGNRAYLPMAEGDGVAVVDISAPMHPRFLTSYRDPILNRAYGIAVRDRFVIAGARHGNSLVVLDRQILERVAPPQAQVPQLNFETIDIAPRSRIDAIAYLGEGVVIAGTRASHPGYVHKSTDYGASWSQVGNVTGKDEITCLASGNNGVAYLLTGQKGHVWKTTDYGDTWRDMGQVSTATNPRYANAYGMVVTPSDTVLVADADSKGGHIHRSTDNGETWQDVGRISTHALYRLNLVGDGVIANGWAGHVYKSVDDGVTWQDMGKLIGSDLYAIEYLGGGKALIGTKSGNVFLSNDNGVTWQDKGVVGSAADDFAWLGGGTVLYSTYTGNRKLYLSGDSGATWMAIGGIGTPWNDDWLDHFIGIRDGDVRVVVGGTNKGVIRFARVPGS